MRDPARLENPGGTETSPVIAVCGMRFEAAIAAGPGVVTLCGLGHERLVVRLEELIIKGPRYRGIISFGLAGGLNPALSSGTCVIADRIVTAMDCFPVDAGWITALRACLPGAVQGALAGVNQPMLDAVDKARLWQSSGADAVDMESHRAALVAQRHNVPFAACRVVADSAHRSVSTVVLAGMRDDGTMALARILRTLAAHPRQLPALIGLAIDAGAAKRTLRVVRSHTGVAFAIPTYC